MAGPAANFLLAILIFTFIYMLSGKDFTPAQINEVKKDSPAHVVGIKSGDVILSINNKKVKSILEVSTYINTSTKERVLINILRNDRELEFNLKPEIIKTEDSLGNKINKKVIGIKISPLNNEFRKKKLGPATAFFYAVKETWFVTQASLDFVTSMFKGKADTSQLGGPIKIAKITGQVSQHGFIAFLKHNGLYFNKSRIY